MQLFESKLGPVICGPKYNIKYEEDGKHLAYMSILNSSKEEYYLPDRFRYLEVEELSLSRPYSLKILAPVAILQQTDSTNTPDLSDESDQDDDEQSNLDDKQPCLLCSETHTKQEKEDIDEMVAQIEVNLKQ